MKNAEATLENEERVFADATAAMGRGAWAGPLKLCRDTVLNAESGFEDVIGQPMVLITLRPSVAGALSALTGRAINGPLDIRLDGEVISEPIVYERIDRGEFQVTGPELPVLNRLSEAVIKPC
jgi:preprotein translocase subunit SecD